MTSSAESEATSAAESRLAGSKGLNGEHYRGAARLGGLIVDPEDRAIFMKTSDRVQTT